MVIKNRKAINLISGRVKIRLIGKKTLVFRGLKFSCITKGHESFSLRIYLIYLTLFLKNIQE